MHPSQLSLGAVASPGDIRYKDLNEDGVIDQEDRTYLGDPIPDYTFGLNLGVNYRNFDFSLYAFASVGQEMVRNYERVQVFANRLNYYIERWRVRNKHNRSATYYRAKLQTTSFLTSLLRMPHLYVYKTYN